MSSPRAASPALDVALRLTDTDLPAGEQLAVLLVDIGAVAVEQIAVNASRVHFATTVARDRAVETLRRAPSVSDVRSIDVADGGWAVRSQASLRAVTIDRLVVAPPWDVPAHTDRRVVIVEPSMGFGTGHHPSTRLCLRALQEIFRLTAFAKAPASLADQPPPRLRRSAVASAKAEARFARRRKPGATKRSLLDVGTGSGVLAIAASLLGAADVAGIDSDPDAIESARRNLLLNPGAAVRFECADAEAFTDKPHDVVLANLTMDLLCRHAGALRRLLTGGGVLVASGFTGDQERGVASAFGALSEPLVPVHRLVEGDWIALVHRSPQTN